MAIRLMKVDVIKLANGIFTGTKEGDHLISFPGGVQFIVPQEVIDNLDPEQEEPLAGLRIPSRLVDTTSRLLDRADIPRQAEHRHDHPQPEIDGEVDETGTPIDPEKDYTSKVCVECGRTVKQTMPSGKCYSCATVRCPTCKAEVKRADMTGQYCPNCLRRPGRD